MQVDAHRIVVMKLIVGIIRLNAGPSVFAFQKSLHVAWYDPSFSVVAVHWMESSVCGKSTAVGMKISLICLIS